MITTHEQKSERVKESLNILGPSDIQIPIKKLLKTVIYRWLALALICFIVCGSYFCYDNPATLQIAIMNAFDVSVAQYSLLYSIYSFPNIVIPIFGGKLIDRYGKGKCLIVTTLLVFVGQTMQSFGAAGKSFHLLFLGRLIFGMGSETLFVVQAVYVNDWFKNQEISLAMGFASSFPNLLSFFSGIVVPKLYL